MLGLIDMKLKEVFFENNNNPFNNQSVIILGDFE